MKKLLILSFVYLLNMLFVSASLFAQSNSTQQFPSDLVGHWTFNNTSNLTKAAVGNNLVLTGDQVAVDGPSDTSGAVRIGIGSHYSATHGISPNGGGSKVNSYTIVMDVKIPSIGKWYALYQTDPTNSNDGDWFVHISSGGIGIGATGYTGKALRAEEWHRIALSVSNGRLSKKH